MRRRLLRTTAALVIAASVALFAQSARRVTIVTTKGDTVEGTLRSMTADQVVIEIAGQPVTVATANIKYLSFVGRVDGSTSSSGAAPVAAVGDPMTKAFDALKSLRTMTEVGVLREPYSTKLLEVVPVVRQFAEVAGGWNDLRSALNQAAEAYREPMATLSNWSSASRFIDRAEEWTAYATDLRKRPNEEQHKESQEIRTALFPSSITGRLGFGDRLMPVDLNAPTVGGFNDLFSLTVTVKTTLEMTMTCAPCKPTIVIANVATSRKLIAHSGYPATVRWPLETGTYAIWAGTESGQVGQYKFDITVAK